MKKTQYTAHNLKHTTAFRTTVYRELSVYSSRLLFTSKFLILPSTFIFFYLLIYYILSLIFYRDRILSLPLFVTTKVTTTFSPLDQNLIYFYYFSLLLRFRSNGEKVVVTLAVTKNSSDNILSPLNISTRQFHGLKISR